MFRLNSSFVSAALTFALISGVAASSFGQRMPSEKISDGSSEDSLAAPSASVAPVVFDGRNIDCADLNASTDTRFSHIIDNYELKLDFNDPNGTFPFTTGGGRVVVGPQYANRFVSIASGSATVSSWTSQIPITAVNVKIGNTSYVYPYKPFKFSDTNLATGDNRGISHVSFCFGEATGVTAGEGSISGRVVDASGRGISRAQLVLINGATGEARIAMSSAFGYYSFKELDVREVYVLNVSHRRFVFAERQRSVSLIDDFTGADFIAEAP